MRLKSVLIGHGAGLVAMVVVVSLLVGCPPPETEPARLDALWEEIPTTTRMPSVYRTPTPNGWLVVTNGGGPTHLDDPAHLWLRHPQRSPDQPEVTPGDFEEESDR